MPNDTRTCTAERRSGEFCDAPSIPDAPFPICPTHARQVVQFAAQLSDRMLNRAHLGIAPEAFTDPQPDPERRPRSPESCVYFVRVGELIKIGASDNWNQRRRSYPPHAEVLLVHFTPRAWHIEKSLHVQFRQHLARGREWFTPHAEITNYIADLREQQRLAS